MSPTIAIVGRPNVGKSTLFNRLSRSKSALVDNAPGITRDRLYENVTYRGVPFTIVDTGGFEDIGQDPLLSMVREQVFRAIEDSDLVLFMVDGKQGLMPGDEEMAALLRRVGKKVYLAVNKIDGPEHDHLLADFYGLGIDPILPVSAAHGYGLRSMMAEVTSGLSNTTTAPQAGDQTRIAVLGRPNAGKSSLINRILGHDRLLVNDYPGTTRDSIDTEFTWRGRSYLLVDTAGIRRKSKVKEKIEKFSVIKALRTIDRCHVTTVLLDADREISDQDARICGYALDRGKGIVLALNKWDLLKKDVGKRKRIETELERRLNFLSFAPILRVSALTGERVMELFEKIDLVYTQYTTRISTSDINKAVGEMVQLHPPPRIGRRRLKFFYATQSSVKPPTFVLFVNVPDMIHFSYERFLINQLRVHFNLANTPIRLIFRKK